MFSNNEFSIIEFDCYLRERTVLILLSFIKKNRESIKDATAELQVKIIWSNWIPVFKIYQWYVPSINLLALLVHKKIFKY